MRVVVSGGGTGGHIYPALALINEIKKHQPNAEFLYIGSKNGLEQDIVKKAGIPFESIVISGFKRKITLDNLKTVYRFLNAVSKSRKLIKNFKPDIVIGTGGYVCGPVLYAATKENIPTLVHEQNVIPGLTNKFLSRYVDLVAISMEGSRQYFNNAKKIVLTGNPRATEVALANKEKGRQALNITNDKKIVLFVGGSRGATAINETFLNVLPDLIQYKNVHFIFVTGDIHYDSIKLELEKRLHNSVENISLYPFIYNMPEVLASTDVIVSRAGASTLAEITALGIPSILIPSPYVTNNHQELNARWMEEQGAAKMIIEKELKGENLLNSLQYLLENHVQSAMAAKRIGEPDAATKMYKEITGLISNRN